MMLDTTLMAGIAHIIEMAGVAAIIASIALATLVAAMDISRRGAKAAYDRYRANLGRGILLGLELLVGADIIATVTGELTWNSVGLLGAVVLIRTFLSFSLETEIEGSWPWNRRRDQAGTDPER